MVSIRYYGERATFLSRLSALPAVCSGSGSSCHKAFDRAEISFSATVDDDIFEVTRCKVTKRAKHMGRHAIERRGCILQTVLGRQVIADEDEDDDHCTVCIASGINTNVSPGMDLRDEIVAAYADDAVYAGILAYIRSSSDETQRR
ncbi:hypothetical protein PR003_g10483 [Phytophthora rubi]|uniref:Uncharacterized protein n=2 Tax=Phytophthora rubi TaxID=129364 RepID=A0A6A3LX14_9STRA|nr:hypothetical protein PR001_g12857 [Phytophthora rubi]KAE9340456.1 hypothetical protein PR003_g10483 [Phytophthora rubi]